MKKNLRLITLSSAFQGMTEKAVRANHTELMSALEEYFTLQIDIVDKEPVAAVAAGENALVFVASGGTEGTAVRHYAELPKPLRLLTDGKANSLAASMELACWVRQQGGQCEIIHDDVKAIACKLNQEMEA